MSNTIVSRPPSPVRRLTLGLAVVGALFLVTAIAVAVVLARLEVAATPADVVGPPVRAQTAAGDRVFLLTSQWKTYRTRYSRHGISRPAYTALLVDVWAFDAGTGKPLWRRRLESDRRGVNAGRALLGAEPDVLWLLTSRGLLGISTSDGASIADAAAIEAKNPHLASRMPREPKLFRFDAAGLGFRSADGRDWRLDGATLAASQAGQTPPTGPAKAFPPARLSGGVSTWAFHEKGLHLTGRWIGVLSAGEAQRSQERRTLVFAHPDEAPRVRLWSATARREAGFVGERTWLSDFAPLPESPEFLRGGLLSDGNLKNQPIMLFEPDSLLVLHWDRLGDDGRIRLSRVAPRGRVLWTASLPMSRLDAVMPGERTLTLLGSRPEPDLARPRERAPVEVDQLVTVDLQTGRTSPYGFRFKAPEGAQIPRPATPPDGAEK